MIDLATLAIKVDSREVETGVDKLDELARAGTQAEAAVDKVGDSSTRTASSMRGSAQAASQMAKEAQNAALAGTAYGRAFLAADNAIENLARAQAEATREIAAAKTAYKAGEISLEQYNAELLRTKSALGLVQAEHSKANAALRRHAVDANRAGQSSRLAGHHVQNLTFQLQDLAVGLASGQRPMTVFLQQGTQIAGVMQQAEIGVGGLGKELGRMAVKAGPAILILGTLAGAIAAVQYEINQGIDTDELTRGLGLTTAEIEKLQDAHVTFGDVVGGMWDYFVDQVTGAVTDALNYFGITFEEAAELGVAAINTVINSIMVLPRVVVAALKGIPAALGDAFYSGVNLAINAINALIQKAVNGINVVIALANNIPGVDLKPINAPSFSNVGNDFEGGMESLGSGVRQAFAPVDYVGQAGAAVGGYAFDRRRAELERQALEIIEQRDKAAGGAAGGSAKRTGAINDEVRALAALLKASQAYIDSLREETEGMGKTVLELKQMEIAAEAAKAPTEALRQAILAAGEAWELEYRAKAEADFKRDILDPLDQEIKLLGLVGPAREYAALAFEREAFEAEMAARGIEDVNAAWEEYASRKNTLIDRRAEEDAIRDLADLYQDLFTNGVDSVWDTFKQQGLRIIAEIASAYTLALLSGKPTSGIDIGGIAGQVLGNGPLGGLFGSVGTGGAANDNGFGDLTDIVRKNSGGGVDPGTGEIVVNGTRTAAAAPSLLGQIGVILGSTALGNMIGGNDGTLGTVGSGLGAAAGMAIGGPIGAAVGAIIGNLISGLAASTKRGSAIIGDAGGSLGVTGFYGNSSSRKDTAGQLGGSLIDSLGQIADALGVDLDSAVGKVSIGVRKDKFRVDPEGRGFTKLSAGAIDFGSDEQAAIEYAIRDLIQDGVLKGISAASQKILSAGGDLERAIEKAVLIESVPKLLKQRLDPLGAALEEIDTKFKQLADALREGGATAQQFADAERLYKLEREDAIEQFGRTSETLRQFLDSLAFGSNSPLSLRQQLGNAAAALQPFEQAIAAGTTIDQAAYTEAAQAYLEISRQVNASGSGFFSDFNRIRDLTSLAISNVENATTLPGEAPDIFSQQTAQNTADMANILTDVRDLLRGIANDNGTIGSSENIFFGGTRGFTA